MGMLMVRAATAIGPQPSDSPFPKVWSTYLASEALDATAATAKEAGSQFMMEPMDVMTAGRLGLAIDPRRAPYGIWQASDHQGVGIDNEPGALVWNELMTRDEGAKAFYAKVLGFAYQEIGEGFGYSTVRRLGDGNVVAGMGELGITTPAEVHASWIVRFRVEGTDASAATAVRLGAGLRQPCHTPVGKMSSLIGAQGETSSPIQTASEE